MDKKWKISLSLFLVSVFLLGFLIGASAQGKKVYSKIGDSKEIYEYLKTFSDAIDLIKRSYVDEVKDRDIIYSAIKGVLESLDPHSTFLTPDMYKDMQTETKGEFGGIGIEITIKDGFPTVITAIEDTPAYKAGLKSNDHIIKIDGKPARNMSLMDVVKMIRGQKGKPVTLTIMREGFTVPKDFTVVRDVITVKSVKYRMIDNGYGYIRIAQFQERTAKDLDNAIKDLEKMNKEKPLKGILLDLRNNPGGLLEQAVDVSDKFLSEGLIVYIEGRQKEESKMNFYASKKNDYTGPLVVLVNEGSASASEIVAGAMQDYKRAIIVGAKTFGKGSVQTIYPLSDGSAVRLTTAKYYTPKGRSIQAEGIVPDILIDNNYVRSTKEKMVPLKEKDLERHLEVDKNSTPKTEGSPQGLINEDDFQLVMALQILKSWDALRGK
ncbi:MAG: S41 family peptidase [Syntrophorhabdaceae bacterium]|nr:S41 family peptidase [Syntrophorhabdaceae bacterium]